MLKQPALAAIEEVEATVRGPKLKALAEGLRQDKLAQIALLKMRALMSEGKSPAATLLSLFSTIPSTSCPKGGMLLDRQIYQVEAMRRYAEWLMQRGAADEESAAPRQCAGDSGSRAGDAQSRPRPRRLRLTIDDWLSSQSCGCSRPKLDPKADVTALQARAVQQHQRLATLRPLARRLCRICLRLRLRSPLRSRSSCRITLGRSLVVRVDGRRYSGGLEINQQGKQDEQSV